MHAIGNSQDGWLSKPKNDEDLYELLKRLKQQPSKALCVRMKKIAKRQNSSHKQSQKGSVSLLNGEVMSMDLLTSDQLAVPYNDESVVHTGVSNVLSSNSTMKIDVQKPSLSMDMKLPSDEKKSAKRNLTNVFLGISDTINNVVYDNKDVTVVPTRHAVRARRFRTPSPQIPNRRSCSPQLSPLPVHIAAQLKSALSSPGFQLRKHSALTTVLERAKQKAALRPRCKYSRALMNGYECDCCKDHYDAMGFKDAQERRDYVNRVSKHRGFEQAPPTPPRYWDLDVPSKEEQVKLGYVIETDSPLFKSAPRKKYRLQ